ncbi:hypothetical protein HPP92_003940 [Vanilla planifolia]|uniref:Uncharacterized protein n=1 Tax=Vanilla planifolia TaxID=51239 RepID=A0A835RW10_VANPL|nr:hypothetical protein HPP92_003940 [Vanilla planifolia]
MDAVELPLPVNVLVDKLMGSDGLEIGGEMMGRSSAGKGATTLQKGSGCGASRLEYTSPSRNKKVDVDSRVHGKMASCTQYEDNSRRHHVEETGGHIQLSPNHVGKILGRKSAKKPVIIPYKRLRNDETEIFKKNAEYEVILNEVGFDSRKCTLDAKSPVVKQKRERVHDGKRTEKKNCRSSLKNKYECLASKAGLVCNDAFSAGNTILGTHSFKSDMHDVAKHLDELSISKLMDGSYKYLKLPVDKGKKSLVLNDSILSSVRKICSILGPSSLGVVENSSNLKVPPSSQDRSFSTGSDSDSELKDKQLEESLAKAKAQNSSKGNWLDAAVLQPKSIMESLSLPPAQELESSLLNSNMCSAVVQSTENAKSCNSISLPPYPWSSSHGGNSRATSEFCKVNSTKNICEGKWVRIARSNTSFGDDVSFSTGLIFECGCDEDAINKQKINEILQEMKNFNSTFQNPSNGLCNTHVVGNDPNVKIPDIIESVNRSGVPVSFDSRLLKLHDSINTSNSHPLENGSKDHASQVSTISEVVLSCKGKEIGLNTPKICLSFKDEAASRKCGQDFSSEEISAAITLLEMASCSDSLKASNTTHGKIRWPKAPSTKPMKARKSFPSSARLDDLIKQASTLSAKHQVANERKTDFPHLKGSVREAARWSSIPMGTASSANDLEKDLSHSLPPETNSFMPSPSCRNDKAYDKQVRKVPAKPPASFEGSSIKDWIRGKSKRL